LEYLRLHPHIKRWVAVDDIDMSKDLSLNFVKTYPKITTVEADKCIEILGKIQ
jgi:ribosomal protein S3AE